MNISSLSRYKVFRLALAVLFFCGFPLIQSHADSVEYAEDLNYAFTDKGQRFIDEMTGKDGYTRAELKQLFSQVSPDEKILAKISRPAEKTMLWKRYKRIFSDKKRLNGGVRFYRKHRLILEQAYKKYGVPPSIIVAILGVETRYGKVTGNDSVLTALSTIAFDYPKREVFFTKELKAFLHMCKKENINPLVPKGSYAGAMGMAQFMPSSYLHYAVDYDGDGKRDLWTNAGDAIFSIANYLAENGWQRDAPIVDEALLLSTYEGKFNHKPFTTLLILKAQGIMPKHLVIKDGTSVGLLQLDDDTGKQTYITLKNFAVITTYNTSPMYAMAVVELAKAIEEQQ